MSFLLFLKGANFYMDKSFWRRVAIIGIPVALSSLIGTVLNMLDIFMIGNFGDDYVSAVGLANKVFFVLNLLLIGIVSGSAILISQYYGKGDEEGINKVFGFSLIFSALGGLIFFLLAYFMPDNLMRIFTNDERFIEIGSSYLKIVSISYILTSVSTAITGLLKSVNKTSAPMLITLGCVAINFICNYIFIFGNLGSPVMKADGAALGTVIARSIEIIALTMYCIFTKKSFELHVKRMFSLKLKFILSTFIFILPVLINEFGWGLGTTVYSVIYGHMDETATTTMTIATCIQDLVYVFLLGMSNAAAILIGNELGADKFSDAKRNAKRLLVANTAFGVVLGLILVGIVYPYTLLYPNISEVVKKYVIYVCIVYAIILPFKAFNITSICGVLRAGGDTIVSMIIDIAGIWTFAIPLGCLGAFVFNLNVVWVFALISLEEVIKLFFSLWRTKQGKWIKNVCNFDQKIEVEY